MFDMKNETNMVEGCKQIERILKFMLTFDNAVYNLEFIGTDGSGMKYKINDDFIIWNSLNEVNILYNDNKDDTYGGGFCYSIRSFKKDDITSMRSFYNDDYYVEFIYFNSEYNGEIEIQIEGKDEIVFSYPEYDLETDDGAFQYSCLYSNDIVNIQTINQYFYKRKAKPFSVWLSLPITKLYRILDEQFNISREDSTTN
ncbi:hypothetical protein ENKO_054 [Klebsiella phage fENko-Kae01]|nr:hypothetical protein [Klebsiella phage fENko-Kae01]